MKKHPLSREELYKINGGQDEKVTPESLGIERDSDNIMPAGMTSDQEDVEMLLEDKSEGDLSAEDKDLDNELDYLTKEQEEINAAAEKGEDTTSRQEALDKREAELNDIL